jgi:hypothetical protein
MEGNTMSTYANGTQQTYREIWASMELSCAGLNLMPAIRTAASETAVELPATATSAGAGIEWPDLAASGHRRKHHLRTARRSARGRRRIAARIR